MTLLFAGRLDASCERASGADGSVIAEPVDQPWDPRQPVIDAPEGLRWEVTEHSTTVASRDWGAKFVWPLAGAGG